MWALPVSRIVFVTSLLFRAGFQYSAACSNVVLFIVLAVNKTFAQSRLSFCYTLHFRFSVAV